MNLGSKYIVEKMYVVRCAYSLIYIKKLLKSDTHLKIIMTVEAVPNDEVKELRICTAI